MEANQVIAEVWAECHARPLEPVQSAIDNVWSQAVKDGR
jgi:hypothetical protein